MKNALEFIVSHKGAVAGAVIGLILAILMISIGFWKTLLMFILVLAGIFIGVAIDDREWLTEKSISTENKKLY